MLALWAGVQKSSPGCFSRGMRGEQHQWGEQKAKTPVSASCAEPRREDTLRSQKQILILATSETGLKMLESLLALSVELSGGVSANTPSPHPPALHELEALLPSPEQAGC